MNNAVRKLRIDQKITRNEGESEAVAFYTKRKDHRYRAMKSTTPCYKGQMVGF